MKKIISLTLLFTGILLADNAASNTKSAQRWPWNNKVDINYTLTATTTNAAPVFRVNFFGLDPEGNEIDLMTLSGDGKSGIIFGAGPKRTTWDAGEDLGTEIDTAGYKIGVYAEDITDQATYLVLDLTTYQMIPSATGPDTSANAPSKYKELWFRRIEPGTFIMGANANETYRMTGENEHLVKLTKPYYIGVFEVTEGQYDRINADGTSSSCLPKLYTSYDLLRGQNLGSTWPEKKDYRVDSSSFLGKLRKKTGSSIIIDLPTEAQWEAAARWKGTIGNGTNDYYGSGYWNNGVPFNSSTYLDSLSIIAWYNGNSSNTYHEVGLKAPSAIGTYDMIGNVYEWCMDWNGAYDTSGIQVDPEGAPRPSITYYGYRLFRGGSCVGHPRECRMAYRGWSQTFVNLESYGLRLALIP